MMTRTLRDRTSRIVLAWVAAALVAADDPKKPPATPAEAHQREAAEVAEALRESWPDHPEWVDMLTGILEEEPMGPDFGWFRTAKTQTRFGWDAVRQRFDRNHDGRVTPQEMSAGDDFPRLDRNHDGVLTPPDFDFSGSSLAPSLGSMVFARCRPRRQWQGHARGARCLLPGCRQRRPGLPVALRPARSVRPAAGTPGRVGPAVEGDPGPRPLPPGDRLARARAEAGRQRARLHAQDQ